ITYYIKNPTPQPTLIAAAGASFGNIIAYFYPNPKGSTNGTFDRNSSSPSIFTQSFPVIAFNPNPSMQNCSESTGVNTNTRPFTDILQNPDGSCKKIPAQDDSGNNAGVGNLYSFEAVYLTSV